MPWRLDFGNLQGRTIGFNEGSSSEMIGMVRDLDIDSEAVYYTDYEYHEARVYDLHGTLKAILGKEGVGPGEMLYPSAVAATATDEGQVLVFVGAGRRVHVFRQQDSTYVPASSFLVAASLRRGGDLCVMHGHVYTIGLSDELDGIIHKYTLVGEYVMSFGTAYQSPSDFVRNVLAPRGVLECNKMHRVIGYVHPNIPVLTGYSETGTVLWRVKFGDLKITPEEEHRVAGRARRLATRAWRPGEARMIQLLAGGTDTFTVTYLTDGRTGRRHFFTVDVVSGLGAYLGGYAPYDGIAFYPTVLAVDSTYVYTVKHNPYPQIGIYRRQDTLP